MVENFCSTDYILKKQPLMANCPGGSKVERCPPSHIPCGEIRQRLRVQVPPRVLFLGRCLLGAGVKDHCTAFHFCEAVPVSSGDG
jgi:hypothetical protein